MNDRSLAMIPVDERQRGLEHRIEAAKDRILADLRRASDLFKETIDDRVVGVGRAGVRIGLMAIGALALGVVVTLVRRRRRRLIVTWR